jgi:hypothetical protein
MRSYSTARPCVPLAASRLTATSSATWQARRPQVTYCELGRGSRQCGQRPQMAEVNGSVATAAKLSRSGMRWPAPTTGRALQGAPFVPTRSAPILARDNLHIGSFTRQQPVQPIV